MGRRGECLQPTLAFAKLAAQFESFTCQPRGREGGRAWVRVRELERVGWDRLQVSELLGERAPTGRLLWNGGVWGWGGSHF